MKVSGGSSSHPHQHDTNQCFSQPPIQPCCHFWGQHSLLPNLKLGPPDLRGWNLSLLEICFLFFPGVLSKWKYWWGGSTAFSMDRCLAHKAVNRFGRKPIGSSSSCLPIHSCRHPSVHTCSARGHKGFFSWRNGRETRRKPLISGVPWVKDTPIHRFITSVSVKAPFALCSCLAIWPESLGRSRSALPIPKGLASEGSIA